MADVKINDMLWQMQGTRQNDKIHWKATPKVVEVADERKFLFYSGGGGSLGLIGKIWFRTKEECEQDFLKNYESFDESIDYDKPIPENVGELPRTDWNTYEVCKFNGIDSTTVYKGGFGHLVNITDQLTWHRDSDHIGEYGMEIEFLELHEISDQINTMGMVTVIEEDPMTTKIFQWGNYPGDNWICLGSVQGYA